MTPEVLQAAPTVRWARGLVPWWQADVDWCHPLSRSLVDFWPGVQLTSAARRCSVLTNAGGAACASRSGPVWQQNAQALVHYGDTTLEAFERTDAFSVSFQVGWSALGANDAVLNRSASDTARRGWCVYKSAADALCLLLASDMGAGNCALATFDLSPTVGVLYRVLLTYDGTSSVTGACCYVDGRVLPRTVAADALTATIAPVSTYLRVGYRDTDVWGHNGWVRDVAIWRRALSVDEALAYLADPGQLLLRDPGLTWPAWAPIGTDLYPISMSVGGDSVTTAVSGDGLTMSAWGDGVLVGTGVG